MRSRFTSLVLAGLLLGGHAAVASPGPQRAGKFPQNQAWTERPIRVPVVGQVIAYVPKKPPEAVVLFLSGDGGWNKGVLDMARMIATRAVVIGISYPALRKAAGKGPSCWYPAGDLEEISHAAQKHLQLAQYMQPILAGYSSGATLVYGALAAAPPTTFAGGLSLGFCPDLPSGKPVCPAGTWRPTFDTKDHIAWLPHIDALPHDWFVLNGVSDKVCDTKAMQGFVSDMTNAHIETIEGTGHGFGNQGRWSAVFNRTMDALIARSKPRPALKLPPPPSSRDMEADLSRLGLPLDYSWAEQPDAFLVFVSGDGGWASLDAGVATALQAARISTVGLSSLRYFWREKTPAQVAGDLSSIVSALLKADRPVFAGGYSFGASALPVALQRGGDVVRGLSGLVLISPSRSATFEIDPLDWVRNSADNPAARVMPAVLALNLPTLCVAGSDETDGACLEATSHSVEVLRLPGSHHYQGNYHALGEAVRRFIQSRMVNSRGRSR